MAWNLIKYFLNADYFLMYCRVFLEAQVWLVGFGWLFFRTSMFNNFPSKKKEQKCLFC